MKILNHSKINEFYFISSSDLMLMTESVSD